MVKSLQYHVSIKGEERFITITPVQQYIPGKPEIIKGVFKLTAHGVDMGEIVFDDKMNEWEYTGTGDLTHEQAGPIAEFIRNNIAALISE